MQNYCVLDLSFNGPCRQRQKSNMASPASMVFAGLGQFNVKMIQTPKTSMDLAGLASSRGPRDVQTVTYAMAREARTRQKDEFLINLRKLRGYIQS